VTIIQPDERAFRSDLEKPAFQIGVDRGLWEVKYVRWPHVLIVLARGVGRAVGAAPEIGLRFDLTGYPSTAPTAAPWDHDEDGPLEPSKWPAGERISQVFNPGWRVDALYMPFDRVALQGHDAWLAQRPGYAWDGNSDITRYLRFVVDLLSEEEENVAAA
jgi:hypothetical protein